MQPLSLGADIASLENKVVGRTLFGRTFGYCLLLATYGEDDIASGGSSNEWWSSGITAELLASTAGIVGVEAMSNNVEAGRVFARAHPGLKPHP